MAGNGLATREIRQRLIDLALSLGKYETVNGHPPANKVQTGLHCFVEFSELGPARNASGLNSTTVRMLYTMQTFSLLESEPRDDIDPKLLDAADALFAALSDDFQLGGDKNVRDIDLLGRYNTPLSIRAGYYEPGGQKFRAMTLYVPVIINDVWEQNP